MIRNINNIDFRGTTDTQTKATLFNNETFLTTYFQGTSTGSKQSDSNLSSESPLKNINLNGEDQPTTTAPSTTNVSFLTTLVSITNITDLSTANNSNLPDMVNTAFSSSPSVTLMPSITTFTTTYFPVKTVTMPSLGNFATMITNIEHNTTHGETSLLLTLLTNFSYENNNVNKETVTDAGGIVGNSSVLKRTEVPLQPNTIVITTSSLNTSSLQYNVTSTESVSTFSTAEVNTEASSTSQNFATTTLPTEISFSNKNDPLTFSTTQITTTNSPLLSEKTSFNDFPNTSVLNNVSESQLSSKENVFLDVQNSTRDIIIKPTSSLFTSLTSPSTTLNKDFFPSSLNLTQFNVDNSIIILNNISIGEINIQVTNVTLAEKIVDLLIALISSSLDANNKTWSFKNVTFPIQIINPVGKNIENTSIEFISFLPITPDENKEISTLSYATTKSSSFITTKSSTDQLGPQFQSTTAENPIEKNGKSKSTKAVSNNVTNSSVSINVSESNTILEELENDATTEIVLSLSTSSIESNSNSIVTVTSYNQSLTLPVEITNLTTVANLLMPQVTNDFSKNIEITTNNHSEQLITMTKSYPSDFNDDSNEPTTMETISGKNVSISNEVVSPNITENEYETSIVTSESYFQTITKNSILTIQISNSSFSSTGKVIINKKLGNFETEGSNTIVSSEETKVSKPSNTFQNNTATPSSQKTSINEMKQTELINNNQYTTSLEGKIQFDQENLRSTIATIFISTVTTVAPKNIQNEATDMSLIQFTTNFPKISSTSSENVFLAPKFSTSISVTSTTITLDSNSDIQTTIRSTSDIAFSSTIETSQAKQINSETLGFPNNSSKTENSIKNSSNVSHIFVNTTQAIVMSSLNTQENYAVLNDHHVPSSNDLKTTILVNNYLNSSQTLSIDPTLATTVNVVVSGFSTTSLNNNPEDSISEELLNLTNSFATNFSLSTRNLTSSSATQVQLDFHMGTTAKNDLNGSVSAKKML